MRVGDIDNKDTCKDTRIGMDLRFDLSGARPREFHMHTRHTPSSSMGTSMYISLSPSTFIGNSGSYAVSILS